MAPSAYPPARRLPLTDDLYGHKVHDPYRWLEPPDSDETREWLAAQGKLFASEVGQLPGRDRLAARIRDLLGIGFTGTPVWRGNRCFSLQRSAGQEHAVLYFQDQGVPKRMLIDPMQIDPSGKTTLDSWKPDNEGQLLAYLLSEGGDEESALYVMDVTTGEHVDGPIGRCRYSPIAWLPGSNAFYYVRQLPPELVPEGEAQYHRRVYLHRIGQPPSEDKEVFGDQRPKTSYYSCSVSIDGRWLVISATEGTAPRNDLWLADLSTCTPERPDLRVVQQDVDARTSLHVGRDGLVYVFTNHQAPRRRLALADPAAPGPDGWRDLIPQDPSAVLEGYAILDCPELTRPILLACWTRHAVSSVTVHGLSDGVKLGELDLPGLGSVSALTERLEGGHEAWFTYTDYTTPPTVYRYDAQADETVQWASPPGSVHVPGLRAEQVIYTSADDTEVRMIVIGRDDDTCRPRPTVLYGYGGFGLSQQPRYSASILTWVEAGGYFAVAGLRGGGEEGEAWHRAGMLSNKQNVFQDFHAAAEKLVAGGWTSPCQLAVSGASNGGLLVGAIITQRPALIAAAACAAPLLDMVRYERSGLGQAWSGEYGSAADPEQLASLLSYSPYHHVHDGIDYPAVLFTVFDNDSRVDPMHARKMCAALQHTSSSGKPVLLRGETGVGHGARALSRSVEVTADTYAFLAKYTGLQL
jgi:prolyl oligopeptidase